MKFRNISTIMISFSLVTLVGCHNLHPVHAGPDLRTQCKTIKRQELFWNTERAKYSAGEVNAKQRELDKAYRSMGCHQVMPYKPYPKKVTHK